MQTLYYSLFTYKNHEGPQGPIDCDEDASDHQAEAEEFSKKSHIIYLLTIIINERIIPECNPPVTDPLWSPPPIDHSLPGGVRLWHGRGADSGFAPWQTPGRPQCMYMIHITRFSALRSY